MDYCFLPALNATCGTLGLIYIGTVFMVILTMGSSWSTDWCTWDFCGGFLKCGLQDISGLRKLKDWQRVIGEYCLFQECARSHGSH